MALLLSMAGLYAVLAYFVSQRSQEIGIRMALGATGNRVLGMVLKRGLGLVAIGLLGGLAGAFACTRMLQAQLYEIGTTDPLTFGMVATAFLVIGACRLPDSRLLGHTGGYRPVDAGGIAHTTRPDPGLPPSGLRRL